MEIEGCAQIDSDCIRIGVLVDGFPELIRRFDFRHRWWHDEPVSDFWPKGMPVGYDLISLQDEYSKNLPNGA